MTKLKKVGVLLGIPLPFWVIGLLLIGFALGMAFPKNPIVTALYISGTYFPKTIVTLAAVLIFNLLAGASAKLVLFHSERAGKLFGLIFGIYVTMGFVSLVYCAFWIPFLTGLPITLPGITMPSPLAWVSGVLHTFSTVLSQQPLLQALVGAIIVGFVTAKTKALLHIAYGLIIVSDKILACFKWLLWYYPIMIGCLAIGIPLKFGTKGVAMYGELVIWIAIVTVVWVICMIIFAKLTTKRTWKQILRYYGTVYPTGFGTGGSYDTLAVNIISAEHDLQLRKEIAEVSIVFGTVLNKNCSTMAILLVTVATCYLMNIPLSLMEIIILIPPIMILGLESPGIPNGAAFFMSPVVAALLAVPDTNLFVTTFVSLYSGFVTMFTTSGNTTDDGVVGMLLNDRFDKYLGLPPDPSLATATSSQGGI